MDKLAKVLGTGNAWQYNQYSIKVAQPFKRAVPFFGCLLMYCTWLSEN